MEAILLNQLRQINWQPAQQPAPSLLSWLNETQSMTKRLERHCREQVIVVPQLEKYIDHDQLFTYEKQQLPEEEYYWLREVIMYGDGKPWIFGRTVVPKKTLDAEIDLLKLGTTPLGRYLFSSPNFSRDNICHGQCQPLWARYSRLRLGGYPLLLTELFLIDSPAY